MKKTILIIVLAVLCLFFKVEARNIAKGKLEHPRANDTLVRPLIAGQFISQGLWKTPLKIIKPSKTEYLMSLDQYKGKVILLDFWATWCGSCLKHFPELDSLQERYKKDLKIILVNSYNSGDTKSKIIRLLQLKNRELKGGLSLPCVISDSILANTFPHTFLPHLVWIGKDGIVKAITSADEVTTKNIDLLLATNSLTTYGKVDESTQQLLYSNNNLPQKNLVQYSILLKGKIDGLGGGARPRKINDSIRGMVFSNRSLFTLFNMAASRLIKDFTPKNLILTVHDSSVFFQPKSGVSLEEWQRKNFYSLDLIVPSGQFANFYKYMLADLNRYSGYTGTIETKDLGCWTIQRTKPDNLFATKGGTYNNTLFETGQKVLKNAPIKDLCEWLNSMTGPNEPVIDQTGYTKMIDINFEKGSDNLKSVNDQLAHWGLTLAYKTLRQDVLIIRDTNNNNN